MIRFCAPLTDRALLKLEGPDALTFLHTLTTQDLHQLSVTRPLYSLLLTPEGRYVADFFILKIPTGLLLDVSIERLGVIRQTLQLYCLRQNVTFQDVTDAYDVLVTLGKHSQDASVANGWTYEDPRLALLGQRWILPKGSAHPEGSSASPIDYKAWRLALGVVETEGLVPHKTLPFDALFHKLNAISVEKGCYLGQELVARTLHRGTVHRHFFPLTLEGETVPTAGETVHFAQEAAGKVVAVYCNLVLAKLSVEAAITAWDTQQPLQAGSAQLRPQLWSWMGLKTQRPTPERPLDGDAFLSLA